MKILSFLKTLFKKRNLFIFGIVVASIISLGSSIVFSSLFSEFVPANIPNSIGEILKNDVEEKNIDEDQIKLPNCVIYPHKLVDIDVMTYHMPEYTTKMRDLYPEQRFLDVYQADWAGLYSPGSVQYENDGPKNNVSFILMPKETYIRSNWLYNDIKLIYPANNYVNAHNAPNEIYITKRYADYLISNDNLIQDGEYEKLVNRKLENGDAKTYNIPYSWSFKNGEKIYPPQYFDVYYKISGIIDDDCSGYQEYKKIYGDFFIANELLNLPIPCITTFNVSKNNKYAKNIFKVALDTYKYESRSSAINQSVGNVHFEYRISFIDELSSENGITNIDINSSLLQLKTNNLFEKFSYKNNIIYLAVFGILFCVSIFSLIYFALLISKHELIDEIGINKHLIITTLIYALSIICGIFTTKALNKLPAFLGLTQFNTISSITIIVVSFIYISIVIARIFKAKKLNIKRK